MAWYCEGYVGVWPGTVRGMMGYGLVLQHDGALREQTRGDWPLGKLHAYVSMIMMLEK